MKITVDRKQFKDALALPVSVLPTRTPQPALQGIKLEAREGVLNLTGTDATHSALVQTNRVDITDPGTAIIPGQTLLSIAKMSSTPTLTIESKKGSAVVIGDGTLKLNIFSERNWINPDRLNGDPVGSFDLAEFRQAISRVRFAAPKTETPNGSYSLHCIALQPLGKFKAELVGSDGNKLGAVEVACRWHGSPQPLLIPLGTIKSILGLPDSGSVQVYAQANMMMFDAGVACVMGPVLEAKYPKWRDFISKDYEATAMLDPRELLECAQQAHLTTSEECMGARMDWSEPGLRIQTACESGRTQIKVPLRSYSGKPVSQGINLNYLTGVVKNAGEEEIEVKLKSATIPMVVIGRGFTGVVTPMTMPEAF